MPKRERCLLGRWHLSPNSSNISRSASMDSRVDKDRVDVVLGNIDNNLASAYKGIQHWDTSAPDNTELVEYYVEKAFVETMVLLEALGLNETLDALRKLNEEAKVKYSRVAMADDLYLVWASKLEQYLEAIKDVLGGTKSGTITKELIEILRAIEYC